jgi:hypothetical protein
MLKRQGINYRWDSKFWSKEELKQIEDCIVGANYSFVELAAKFDIDLQKLKSLCYRKGWDRYIRKENSEGNQQLGILLVKLFPFMEIKSEYHLGEKLRLDQYIPQLKLGWEYDGIQHFQPVTFGGISQTEAEEKYKRQKQLDARKTELCKQQNISLIRIRYDEELTEDLLWERINMIEENTPDEDLFLSKIESLLTSPFIKGETVYKNYPINKIIPYYDKGQTKVSYVILGWKVVLNKTYSKDLHFKINQYGWKYIWWNNEKDISVNSLMAKITAEDNLAEYRGISGQDRNVVSQQVKQKRKPDRNEDHHQEQLRRAREYRRQRYRKQKEQQNAANRRKK